MNYIDLDLAIEKYHAHSSISRSGLMLIKKSPLHYYDKYIANNSDDTQSKALVFGNAFHTLVLEPKKFTDRFGIVPDVDRRTTEGKILYASFLDILQDKQPITKNEFETLKKMTASIESSDLGKQLIADCEIESSLFWIETETKMNCKSRPDIWHSNMIVDLKTTFDASPPAFSRQIGEYGYHIQAAMIQDAIYTITGKLIKDFIFLAVEKTQPFAVGIYQLNEESIEKGREEFLRYLNIYKESMTNNYWPSYKIQMLGLPSYFLKKGE